MRNTFVPQTGHVPCVAGLPFFRVTLVAFWIFRFALHLKQYASAMKRNLPLEYSQTIYRI